MKNKSPVILVIEDNPGTLGVLFNLLNDAGFEVLVARDGEKALEIAEEGSPDLILLDVMLSGIDGFEICRRLKDLEMTRELPVIFMTALTKTGDKVKGFELGAVDYITKPFDPEEVLVRVKTHLTIQQLQRDLLEKNEALEASLERERELNALKSRFVSIASHELRAPLSKILLSKGLLHRYCRKLPESDRIQDMQRELESIVRAVSQMTATLDEVLTITKSEAGKITFSPSMIDLTALCRNLVEEFDAMAPETHSVLFSNSEKPIYTRADPKLLETVLSNLLANAIKYSPQGGTVLCDLVLKEGTILLSVKDEGIGIAEEDQVYLFEAFYRGENAEKIEGSGLGLSIVKQFVELHSGAIKVESEINKGATFTILLPCRQ